MGEKTAEVIILHPEKASALNVLAELSSREDLEAVVVVAKLDGAWRPCWSTDINLGGLSTAAMTLQAQVMREIAEQNDMLEVEVTF